MTVAVVRSVVQDWMRGRIDDVDLGLPEFDDRFNVWRVHLLSKQNGREPVGEIRVANGEVVFASDPAIVAERISNTTAVRKRKRSSPSISFRPISSRLVLGDAKHVLGAHPPGSVQLAFTSPPYFNAKPEYHESRDYKAYLNMLGEVFELCHSVLSEGRFMVVNTSPVLIRRAHRGAASRRIPITYDLHGVLSEIGFEFIDDIIWQKPDGAGWNFGRGRRFAADRQPLQYKPVPVTENIVVYRKKTNKLIDWNLRKHPNQRALQESLIDDGYETTNIWKIQPAHSKEHPAIFPEALAEKVIRYYSIQGDMVLDPFAGIGTTGRIAGRLGRRFLMIEKIPKYFDVQLRDSEISMYHPQICDYQFFEGVI